MADSSLTRDNLFQLNVLIWATFPQPPGAPVTPVLKQRGYSLWSVEQPLDAGPADLIRLQSSGLGVGPNPVVDAVLQRDRDNALTLIECKPESFGTSSGLVPQARGLIAAAGNIAPRLGLPGNPSAECCYVVPGEDADATDSTLLMLAQELADQGLPSCPTGPLGIFVKEDGVYLGLQGTPLGSATLPKQLIPEQRVVSVRSGEDPRPLYIIPWIPDAQEENDLTAFKERVRAELLAWLGKASIGSQATLLFDELLDRVTRGVFRYWRDRSSLRGRVFRTLETILHGVLGDDQRVSIRRQEIAVTLSQQTDQNEIMERVRSASLPQRLPEGVQLKMEDQP